MSALCRLCSLLIVRRFLASLMTETQRPGTLIRWSLPRRCSGGLWGRVRRENPPGVPPYRLVTVWELTGSHPPPRNRKRVNWRETVPGGPQETLPESPSYDFLAWAVTPRW